MEKLSSFSAYGGILYIHDPLLLLQDGTEDHGKQRISG
jgi:hypothetical protein